MAEVCVGEVEVSGPLVSASESEAEEGKCVNLGDCAHSTSMESVASHFSTILSLSVSRHLLLPQLRVVTSLRKQPATLLT